MRSGRRGALTHPAQQPFAVGAAAELDDATEKHPVTTPGAILPAREQPGELLLKLKQPAAALREFDAALRSAPNRFNGLHGAARLAADRRRAQTCRREARGARPRGFGRALRRVRLVLAPGYAARVGLVLPQAEVGAVNGRRQTEDHRKTVAALVGADGERQPPVAGPQRSLQRSFFDPQSDTPSQMVSRPTRRG